MTLLFDVGFPIIILNGGSFKETPNVLKRGVGWGIWSLLFGMEELEM